MSQLILVVDDDEDVAETIERLLRRSGYEVVVAYRGADALALARDRKPALVILDIIMPGMTGLDVCRHMRSSPETEQIPILFLTARGEVDDKIDGFEAGADDYISKPFDMRELQMRVKALLRRSQRQEPVELERVVVGDLMLDCRSFELVAPKRQAVLTPVEFRIVFLLMSNPKQVFSAKQLLQQVWGYPAGTGTPDLVRVHVKNIRQKIEPVPERPIYIKNIKRRGYVVSGG